MNWHRLTIQETYEFLGTDQDGLNTDAAGERLLETGPNELDEGKKKSIGSILSSLVFFAVEIEKMFSRRRSRKN